MSHERNVSHELLDGSGTGFMRVSCARMTIDGTVAPMLGERAVSMRAGGQPVPAVVTVQPITRCRG